MGFHTTGNVSQRIWTSSFYSTWTALGYHKVWSPIKWTLRSTNLTFKDSTIEGLFSLVYMFSDFATQEFESCALPQKSLKSEPTATPNTHSFVILSL